MMFEPITPFVSPWIAVQLATEPWQHDGYRALRRRVFCDEQGLFSGDDADEHDRCALPIVALSSMAGMPDRVVGVVRIYPGEHPVWYGGRLAVEPAYRRHRHIGELLINQAVGTAHALGARRFLATVQAPNVAYFERHNFRKLAPVEVCGQPHALMEADLGYYPPLREAGTGAAMFWRRQCA